jgi:hypothetical protein
MNVTPAQLLLLSFKRDELSVCPRCQKRELLPPWGSPSGPECASCGTLSPGEMTHVGQDSVASNTMLGLRDDAPPALA